MRSACERSVQGWKPQPSAPLGRTSACVLAVPAVSGADQPQPDRGTDGGTFGPQYEQALALLCEGKSRRTADAYESHLRAWWRWCNLNERRSWPADPEDVRAYAEELSSSGLRPLTVRQKIITALGGAHRRAGLPDPSAEKIVRDSLPEVATDSLGRRKAHRDLARHFEQVLAAVPDEMERALLAVLHAGRLTYDELAALRWGDVKRLPGGSGLIRLRWTGETVPIEARTLSALGGERQWRLGRAAPLFHRGARPLSVLEISGIVIRALQAAGVHEPRRRRGRQHGQRGGGSDQLVPQADPRRSIDPEYLQEWMLERGWTAESLSVVLGVSPARLDRWARGIARPPRHLRAALIMIGTAEGADAAGPPPAPTPEAVRAWMDQGGWNDRGLAAALGAARRTIGNWRTGAAPAPPYLRQAISGAEAGTRRRFRYL